MTECPGHDVEKFLDACMKIQEITDICDGYSLQQLFTFIDDGVISRKLQARLTDYIADRITEHLFKQLQKGC